MDDRYFQGLEGQYNFSLHFRLEKDGEHDYIVRSHGNYLMNRSVSVDLDLEPGTYSVLMRITAERVSYRDRPEQVIRDTCRNRRNKLIQIGLAYDLAHARGQVKETEAEKKSREEREAKKKAADHKKRREELRAKWLKDWEVQRKRVARRKRHEKKKEEHHKKVEARKAAIASDLSKNAIVGEQDANVRAADGAEGVDPSAQQEASKATDTSTQDAPPTPESTSESKAEEAQTPAAGKVESLPTKSPEVTAKPTKDVTDSTKDTTAVRAASESDKAVEPKPAEDTTESSKNTTEVPAASTNDQAVECKPSDDEPAPEPAASAKAANFEAALRRVPSVLVNGATPTGKASGTAPGTVLVAGTAPPPSTAAEDNWEYDSLASFDSSMDTDLDLPPTPPPEGVEDTAAAVPPVPVPEEENENQMFEDDPWNAVCVVGLRVYSQDKDTTILIVRPKSEIEGETELDVDDNSKGISGDVSGKVDIAEEKVVEKAEEKAEEKKAEDGVKTEIKEDIPEDIGCV